MTREEVFQRLRPYEQELRASGVAALYLFGSTARREAMPDSDVDLLFDVGDAPHFSLFTQAELQVRLCRLLGTDVDFVERDALRPRIRARVEADMVRLF